MSGPEGVFRPDSENLRANYELDAARSGEFHNDNLYDQNEDSGGEKTDPATGKRIRNDAEVAPEEALSIIDPKATSSEDALGPVEKEAVPDAAEKWLRDNDPEYRSKRH